MYMYNNNIICVYPSNKQEDIYKLTSPKRKKKQKKKQKKISTTIQFLYKFISSLFLQTN